MLTTSDLCGLEGQKNELYRCGREKDKGARCANMTPARARGAKGRAGRVLKAGKAIQGQTQKPRNPKAKTGRPRKGG